MLYYKIWNIYNLFNQLKDTRLIKGKKKKKKRSEGNLKAFVTIYNNPIINCNKIANNYVRNIII